MFPRSRVRISLLPRHVDISRLFWRQSAPFRVGLRRVRSGVCLVGGYERLARQAQMDSLGTKREEKKMRLRQRLNGCARSCRCRSCAPGLLRNL